LIGKRSAKVIKGLYALWYREFRVFTREKSRVISSVALPLFWYFIFGNGVGSMNKGNALDYQHFIFPGFLAMTIIFTGLFAGAYIVWDKKIDFLKEVLITPLSRTTVFFGKAMGSMTDALIQSYFLLFIGYLFLGIKFSIPSALFSMAILFIFANGLISLGLIIGSFMESPEGYGLISSFVIYPLFLLSGAVYPLDNLPGWMQILTRIDPATYAVDALRFVILGSSSMPILLDLAVLILFDILMAFVGTWAFKRLRL